MSAGVAGVPTGMMGHPGHHMSDPQMAYRGYPKLVAQPDYEAILIDFGQYGSFGTIIGEDGRWRIVADGVPAGSLVMTTTMTFPVGGELGTVQLLATGVEVLACGTGRLVDATHYMVANCESLASIAAQLEIPLADLVNANAHIAEPSKIFQGQIINLP